MAEKKYICLRCARDFRIDVITANEARDRGLRISPVTCPMCHTEDVQSVEEFEKN